MKKILFLLLFALSFAADEYEKTKNFIRAIVESSLEKSYDEDYKKTSLKDLIEQKDDLEYFSFKTKIDSMITKNEIIKNSGTNSFTNQKRKLIKNFDIKNSILVIKYEDQHINAYFDPIDNENIKIFNADINNLLDNNEKIKLSKDQMNEIYTNNTLKYLLSLKPNFQVELICESSKRVNDYTLVLEECNFRDASIETVKQIYTDSISQNRLNKINSQVGDLYNYDFFDLNTYEGRKRFRKVWGI